MDALSPAHPARRVVFMKGAQVGGTECGNNWIGYVIHHAPGPMLAVQPTTELAKRFHASGSAGPGTTWKYSIFPFFATWFAR